MKCPLCGYAIDAADPAAQSKCDVCPMGKRCRLVCCPNCGYSFPPAAEEGGAEQNEKSPQREERS